jgi:hypothetical protein
MFSFIAQAGLHIVTMPSWMVVLDVVYLYIKVQVSIIGLMFPKKSSQWPLALGWDQEGGEGGGYTFASMPINKQQLIIVSIKATLISNTIKDEQFTQHSLCTLWLNRCVLCLNLLCVCVCVCVCVFVVSWEIHCTMKGNVVQTLDKVNEALAFFPLAM